MTQTPRSKPVLPRRSPRRNTAASLVAFLAHCRRAYASYVVFQGVRRAVEEGPERALPRAGVGARVSGGAPDQPWIPPLVVEHLSTTMRDIWRRRSRKGKI